MRAGPGFRRLAWAAVACTYALIALGGVVRVTGSGMGCGDDWPLCHGGLLPPLDLPTLIELGHRLAASLVSVLVFALLALAWARHRRDPRLRRPATLAAALLVVQVLLGAVTVKLGLPASTVVLHLGVAMLLLATLLAAALRAGAAPATGSPPGPALRRLATASAGMALATVLLGGLVANLHAGPACQGFPLCNGAILPDGGTRVHLHAAHRWSAFTLAALLVATFVAALRDRAATRAPARWAGAALVVAAGQLAIAAAMVLAFLPPGWRVAHMAAGSLLWGVVAGLLVRVREAARDPVAPVASAPPAGDRGASRRHRRPARATAATAVRVVE